MMKNITPIKGLKFSKTEIEHLLKAWLAISAVFAVIMTYTFSPLDFFSKFIFASITAGVAFIVHELAHKYLAQKYHCQAEFRANFSMLGIMLVLGVLFRVIFAAPGGVVINGYMTRNQYGKISLAGPLSNAILAIVAVIIAILSGPGIINTLAVYSLKINAWLALFNMIPFGAFDGSKIFHWNKNIYFSVVVLCFILMGIAGSASL